MSKKIVISLTILGESMVGKTALLIRYLLMEYRPENLYATIGVEKCYNEMTMFDGNKITIKLWDTSGLERMRSSALSQLHSSKGAIVVFDVTCKKSFEKTGYWLEQIKENSKDIPVVLFGNKCDSERREVSYDEVRQYADKKGILYFETSAKNNIGVKEGFETISEIVYKEIKLSKGDQIDSKIKMKKKKNIFHNGEGKNKNKCGIY